jgi:hypothetical protein
MRHTMHLRPSVAKQPNLEFKTRPKQLLGSLPLVIVLPGGMHRVRACFVLSRVCTPSSPLRERERERVKERVFIFKRNDGCLGAKHSNLLCQFVSYKENEVL